MSAPTAAATIVACLREHGVDRVFCVAGESYLPVLDVLYDTTEIDVVTCRHEGSAAFAALADAKLTGRAGVCLASRSPGAANAAIAVHAAVEDATPLILLVGGVPSADLHREVFQNADLGRQFDGVAKAALTLHDPGRAGELTALAFRVAESGTPGPVVLTLPEDVLPEPDPTGGPLGRVRLAATEVADEPLAEIRRMLAAADRPLLVVGSTVDTTDGRRLVREVADHHNVPVLTSNKNQHLIPNRHRCYAGHLHNATRPDQLAMLDGADLVLAVGTRLDAVTTKGHRFPAAQRPVVHVHPDPARIGRHHRPAIGAAADPVRFLARLLSWPASDPGGGRDPWVARLHGFEVAKAVWQPVTSDDGIVFGTVVSTLDELTGGDATVVVDSGTFTSWTYRYFRFGDRGRLLGISSSAMGFAMGAGVAAALRAGDEPTVVVIGDGGFGMTGGELATACQRRARVVFLVADNGSYGTIRLHQEKHYPDRTMATTLANPDFGRLAESFGALGLTATTPDEVRPCLAKALDHDGPSVVGIRTSLRHITAYRLLTEQPQ